MLIADSPGEIETVAKVATPAKRVSPIRLLDARPGLIAGPIRTPESLLGGPHAALDDVADQHVVLRRPRPPCLGERVKGRGGSR
jgi:hypothetical protein